MIPHLIIPLPDVIVLGRLRDGEDLDAGWEFAGVFVDWSEAEDACIDENDFLMIVPAGKRLEPDGTRDAVFPHRDEEA